MSDEQSGDSGQLVDALLAISKVTYPYCRACRARTHNHMVQYTFNKMIAAHREDCTCQSCNEKCEEECPRGIARRALQIHGEQLP
jgi:hypothetical protein